MVFASGSGQSAMVDMNITPLHEQNNEVVRLHLTASGLVEWNGSAISMPVLEVKLAEAAAEGRGNDGRLNPMRQPRISIDADPASEYELLTKVLVRTSNAQLERVGFVDSGG